MKYTVTVDGRARTVEIDGGTVRLDGRLVEVTVRGAGGPVRRLVIGPHSLEVTSTPAAEPGTWVIAAGGSRLTALVLDERSRHIRELMHRHGVPQGPLAIQAPMPGLVVRVLVKPGDAVQAGTGLVVVEAMKMENELKATAAGTVESVLASAGDRVEKGQPLVRLVG